MKILILLVLIAVSNSEKAQEGELLKLIAEELNALKESEKIPQRLKNAVEDLHASNSNEAYCQTCHMVVNEIIKSGKTDQESTKTVLENTCNVFTKWGPTFCKFMVETTMPTVLYIIENRENLTPERVCAIILQSRKCQDPQATEWSVELPSKGKLEHESHLDALDSPWRILHLTDVHYDPEYASGNDAECEEPICCQKSNGPASDEGNGAGFWGDYRYCDTPWYAIGNFMDQLQASNQGKDLNMAYFTGDILKHVNLESSVMNNTKTIKEFYDLVDKRLGVKTVYPVLGNHEAHPVNFFSPISTPNPDLSTQWLFDTVADAWSRWLPDPTVSTIRKGGYYSVLVKPGFRIIALNSNVCYTENLWLIYDDEDPYDQLKWLVDVLTKAETFGEKVHIISHVPPGDIDCYQKWTHEYRRIVTRFSSTISAQFNGHTHFDEFRLFYNTNGSKPINVAFNGGSFTTIWGVNSNYRIYTVDQRNHTVVDYDHFIYDLAKANKNSEKQPQWFRLYSFKEAYGLTTMSLSSLGDLVERMRTNSVLLQQYFKFLLRHTEIDVAKTCDEECLKQILCGITSVEAVDSINCGVLDLFGKLKSKGNDTNSRSEKVVGNGKEDGHSDNIMLISEVHVIQPTVPPEVDDGSSSVRNQPFGVMSILIGLYVGLGFLHI